jgi:hypothetical protein
MIFSRKWVVQNGGSKYEAKKSSHRKRWSDFQVGVFTQCTQIVRVVKHSRMTSPNENQSNSM